MSNNPSTTQDIKSLTNQRDLFKGLLIGIGILCPCIIAAAIYFCYKKGNIALFLPAVTIMLALIPVYLRVKNLTLEINSIKPNQN